MKLISHIGCTVLALGLVACASATATPVVTQPPTATPTQALTSTPTPDPGPPMLEPVGQFGGEVYALAVRDTTAFTVTSSRIQNIDVSDPANPVLKGQSEFLPIMRGPIAAIDHYVLAPTIDGIVVLDAPSDADPVVVNRLKMSGSSQGIVVSGSIGVVRILGPSLAILDLSDPVNPVIAGEVPLESNAFAVAVSGDLVFVTCQGKFRVIDVSDPSDPKVVSSWALDTQVLQLAVSGNLLYMALSTYDWEIYDFSDPSALKKIVSGSGTPDTVGEATVGSLMFADSDDIYDFSNPASPVLVGGAIGLPEDAQASGTDFAVRGNLLYRGGAGLQIFDLSSAPAMTKRECDCPGVYNYIWQRVGFLPTDIASLTFEGYQFKADTGEMHVVGGFLYTFAPETLYVWDLAGSPNPPLVRMVSIHQPGGPGVQIDTGIVFSELYENQLFQKYMFIDTHDPSNPAVSILPAPWDSSHEAVAASSNRLYVYDPFPDASPYSGSALSVYDMVDPRSPRLMGPAYLLDASASEFTPVGDLVLAIKPVEIGSTSFNAHLIDFTDPALPMAAASGPPELASDDKAVSDGSSLFVVGGDRLAVYDPADLEYPRTSLSFVSASMAGYSGGFVWFDGILEGDENAHLTLVDVRDPDNPRVVAQIDTYGSAYVSDGRFLYVSNSGGGVFIYDLQQP